jgi:hypothetical protein
MKTGTSLAEVMVGTLLIALILGPILGLLSSSNRAVNVSMFEILAFQYASELGEQVQRLSPHLKTIQFQTGMALDQILTDPNLEQNLQREANLQEPTFLPLLQTPETNLGLAVSPLHPAFTSRRFFVRKLDSQGMAILNENAGEFWDVTVSLQWKVQSQDQMTRGASFSWIIREDL